MHELFIVIALPDYHDLGDLLSSYRCSMPRAQQLQPQQSNLAESSKGVPVEEEVSNGGGQVDEAMEEDVEQEGYGELVARQEFCPDSLA